MPSGENQWVIARQ